MNRLSFIGLIVGVLGAGLIGGLSLVSGAASPQTYIYSTGEFIGDNAPLDQDVEIQISNTSDGTVTVEMHADSSDAVTFNPDPTGIVTLSPLATAVRYGSIATPGQLIGRLWFSSSSPRYVVSVIYKKYNAGTGTFDPQEPILIGQDHQQNSTGTDASTQVLAIDTLETLGSKVGNNTKGFCAEGSVRNDAAGVLQMYVTLFSKQTQQVTITYITNKGAFDHVVQLQSNVRYTDDANAFLLKGGVPTLTGMGDVDTSVRVTGSKPLFLACPLYFTRSIGAAGPVAGGTVQDGNHN